MHPRNWERGDGGSGREARESEKRGRVRALVERGKMRGEGDRWDERGGVSIY